MQTCFTLRRDLNLEIFWPRKMKAVVLVGKSL